MGMPVLDPAELFKFTLSALVPKKGTERPEVGHSANTIGANL